MSAALSLADQQRRLHHAVTQQQDDANLLQPHPTREPLLRIYQHAYRARLMAALRDNFGSLPRLMGDDAFDALALAYIDAHPSRQPSIRSFGDRLIDFMAEHDDLVPHPAMTDLARMEWALRSAFDAADAEPMAITALADVPAEAWAGLVLRLHPSAQLLPLHWCIEPAWRALQVAEGDEPELAMPEAGDHLLIVWRPLLETRWRSATSPTEAALLQAAAEGQPFGALCELAAEHVGAEHAAATAVGALQQWVTDGLLAGCHIAPG